MQSTSSVEQAIELLSKLTALKRNASFILHFLRWRQRFNNSNQRKGDRPPLQGPGMLAIVTSVSKEHVQCSRPARLSTYRTNLGVDLITNWSD